MGGKPVGYLQSMALNLKIGLLRNKSEWSERDLNLGPLDYNDNLLFYGLKETINLDQSP